MTGKVKKARTACAPRAGAQEAAENAEMLLIAAENCAEILADLPETKANEKARTLTLLAYIEGFADGSSQRPSPIPSRAQADEITPPPVMMMMKPVLSVSLRDVSRSSW